MQPKVPAGPVGAGQVERLHCLDLAIYITETMGKDSWLRAASPPNPTGRWGKVSPVCSHTWLGHDRCFPVSIALQSS